MCPQNCLSSRLVQRPSVSGSKKNEKKVFCTPESDTLCTSPKVLYRYGECQENSIYRAVFPRKKNSEMKVSSCGTVSRDTHTSHSKSEE